MNRVRTSPVSFRQAIMDLPLPAIEEQLDENSSSSVVSEATAERSVTKASTSAVGETASLKITDGTKNEPTVEREVGVKSLGSTHLVGNILSSNEPHADSRTSPVSVMDMIGLTHGKQDCKKNQDNSSRASPVDVTAIDSIQESVIDESVEIEGDILASVSGEGTEIIVREEEEDTGEEVMDDTVSDKDTLYFYVSQSKGNQVGSRAEDLVSSYYPFDFDTDAAGSILSQVHQLHALADDISTVAPEAGSNFVAQANVLEAQAVDIKNSIQEVVNARRETGMAREKPMQSLKSRRVRRLKLSSVFFRRPQQRTITKRESELILANRQLRQDMLLLVEEIRRTKLEVEAAQRGEIEQLQTVKEEKARGNESQTTVATVDESEHCAKKARNEKAGVLIIDDESVMENQPFEKEDKVVEEALKEIMGAVREDLLQRDGQTSVDKTRKDNSNEEEALAIARDATTRGKWMVRLAGLVRRKLQLREERSKQQPQLHDEKIFTQASTSIEECPGHIPQEFEVTHESKYVNEIATEAESVSLKDKYYVGPRRDNDIPRIVRVGPGDDKVDSEFWDLGDLFAEEMRYMTAYVNLFWSPSTLFTSGNATSSVQDSAGPTSSKASAISRRKRSVRHPHAPRETQHNVLDDLRGTHLLILGIAS